MAQLDKGMVYPPSYSYSSMKKRIYAFLLDYLLIILYGVFLGLLFVAFRPFFQSLYSSTVGMADLASFIMIILPVILYFSLCEGLKGQATWGKRKLGLRVVDQDGSRIGLGRSFLRTIVKFIAWEPAHFVIFRFVFHSHVPEFYLDGILILIYLLIFVYLISPFLNKRKRALYDWVAGTVVISDPKPSVQ